MQAQPGAGGVGRSFIEVVKAQPRQWRQVAQVVRSPWVIRQVGKAFLGGPEGVVAQRMCLTTLLGAPLSEKVAQQGTTVVGQHAALHHRVVVQTRLRKQVDHRSGRTGLRVGGTIHHPPQPGMQQRTTAHRAGFQRDEEFAVVETVVAQVLCRGTQRHDLGVRRRIVGTDGRIAAHPHHLALVQHHSAHGNFARGARGRGLLQRQAHAGVVIGKGREHGFGHGAGSVGHSGRSGAQGPEPENVVMPQADVTADEHELAGGPGVWPDRLDRHRPAVVQ